MESAEIFVEGDSQTIKLPKDYKFKSNKVMVNQIGEVIMLVPQENPMTGVLASLDMFTTDFMESGRKELPIDERDLF
ncbi:MAG: hypothetical protein IKZ58_02510 [Selenomonadaceae bacterium]|nr:hypothetical protein [Selenomonadaceae bacterium]